MLCARETAVKARRSCAAWQARQSPLQRCVSEEARGQAVNEWIDRESIWQLHACLHASPPSSKPYLCRSSPASAARRWCSLPCWRAPRPPRPAPPCGEVAALVEQQQQQRRALCDKQPGPTAAQPHSLDVLLQQFGGQQPLPAGRLQLQLQSKPEGGGGGHRMTDGLLAGGAAAQRQLVHTAHLLRLRCLHHAGELGTQHAVPGSRPSAVRYICSRRRWHTVRKVNRHSGTCSVSCLFSKRLPLAFELAVAL